MKTEETRQSTKGGSVPTPSWPVKKRTHAGDVRAWIEFRVRCARKFGVEPSPFMLTLLALQEGVQ